MEKDLKKLLERVLIFDLIIVTVSTQICEMMFKGKSILLIVGIFTAYANFIFAAITDTSILENKKQKFRIQAYFGFSLRIIISVLICVELCGYNLTDVIVYIIGYSLHLMSLSIYGVNAGRFEGK